MRDRLTAKELRIVALIVQGYKNKEIASQLGTTEQVIKNYLRNVYDKIGVSDRLELALFTIHHRILNEAAAATAATNQPQAGAGVVTPYTALSTKIKAASTAAFLFCTVFRRNSVGTRSGGGLRGIGHRLFSPAGLRRRGLFRQWLHHRID